MQRALIVYNPASRNAPKWGVLLAAAQAMYSQGWQVDVKPTETAGDGTALAQKAVSDGIEVVFACGGDGTINEVINGLAGSQTALGVLRGGMGNVFAKEIGVARAPAEALQVLVDGERRRFDLGTASTEDEAPRYFLLMAGVGFDAEVVKKVPSGPKRWLGSTSYGIWAAREVVRYRPHHSRMLLDGGEWEGDLYWALVSNTRSYGGILDITSQALVDDGLLDVYVFSGTGPLWLASTALRLATRKPEGGSGVSYARVPEVVLETPNLGVQADGEYFGHTPMRFGVAPAALDILVPRGKGAALFSEPSAETSAP